MLMTIFLVWQARRPLFTEYSVLIIFYGVMKSSIWRNYQNMMSFRKKHYLKSDEQAAISQLCLDKKNSQNTVSIRKDFSKKIQGAKDERSLSVICSQNFFIISWASAKSEANRN